MTEEDFAEALQLLREHRAAHGPASKWEEINLIPSEQLAQQWRLRRDGLLDKYPPPPKPEFEIVVKTSGYFAYGTVKLRNGVFLWEERSGKTPEAATEALKERLTRAWEEDRENDT